MKREYNHSSRINQRGFSTSKFVLPKIISPGMILSKPLPWMRIQSRGRPREAGTQLDPWNSKKMGKPHLLSPKQQASESTR